MARRRCRPTRSTPSRGTVRVKSISRPIFRTWSTSTRAFRRSSKPRCTTWIRQNALEERKPKDTEEQFIYKARKKAIGPFKKRMWSLPEDAKRAIGQSLEDRFSFLMKQLRIEDTAGAVTRFVKVPQLAPDRDAEIAAAGGKITAAERKAEGLAD